MNNKSSRPSRDFARGMIVGQNLSNHHSYRPPTPTPQPPSCLGTIVGFIVGAAAFITLCWLINR